METNFLQYLILIWLLSVAWTVLAADDPALDDLRLDEGVLVDDNSTDSNITVISLEDLGLDIQKGTGTLWVNRTGDARIYDLNTTLMTDCDLWIEYWDVLANVTAENNGTLDNVTDVGVDKPESWRYITTADQAEAYGLNPVLLQTYEKVNVYVEEVCGDWNDTYWVNNTEVAAEFGIIDDVLDSFCAPYRVSLEPTEEELKERETALIDATILYLANITSGGELTPAPQLNVTNQEVDDPSELIDPGNTTQATIRLRVRRQAALGRVKRQAADDETVDSETEDTVVVISEDGLIESNLTKAVVSNRSDDFFLDLTDFTNPILYIYNNLAFIVLGGTRTEAFNRYIQVGLNMKQICKGIQPDTQDEFEGENGDDNIGINISLMPWLNLQDLAIVLRDDTAVDNIFDKFNDTKTVGGSYVLPIMERVKYDVNTIPAIFQGQVVVIRVGVYVESISNFQSTTMDYDLDIFLRMAWRDPRLMHNYSSPILVKDEDMLETIWKPDPFFSNAKKADFHEVTFLNFQMKIFQEGEVYYETRIKMNPSCNLVLCKYPHDNQNCGLLIMSFAYPLDQLRFEWFSNTSEALAKNPDVRLPELYITKMQPIICNGLRARVNYTCLKTEFKLVRATGYHVSQTYVPTTLALMFSWVGVWLPEEMMEGRIGVAITVLLTMSTESAGARANLPSVSYTKAIDVWFGFITGFVFVTLLQTLFVIGFDKRSNNLRKWATKKRTGATEEMRANMMTRANNFHAGGRFLDKLCRVMYPLSFCMFLIYYFFVATKGEQDDCIDDTSL